MKMLWRLSREAIRYRSLYVIAIISTLLLTAVNLAAPKVLSSMTGIVERGVDEEGIRRIGFMTAGLVCLYLLRILFRFLSNYLAHKAAWYLVGDMRTKIYDKLERMHLGYFHDKQLDIFSFQQNRFKFCNSFETSRANDSLYFLLYVWKQLNLQPEHDEMHLVGDIPEKDWLLDELRKYLQKAYVINPTAEFNRAPATLIKGMPFDLMTLFTKGR